VSLNVGGIDKALDCGVPVSSPAANKKGRSKKRPALKL
jgi:hypothetical protein